MANEYEEARRKKAEGLRAQGLDPFGQRYPDTISAAEARRRFEAAGEGAPARVAVKLGEDEAADVERSVELLGHAHRVLAGHGIGHQQDLARLSGVKQEGISRMLRAKNDPSVCAVRRIARALHLKVDRLFRPLVGKKIPQPS
jgi:DNA-binding phage protein